MSRGIITAFNKSLKPSYKHLTNSQKRLVKIFERYEQANKFFYSRSGFYAKVKRLENNSVDWESVDDNTMTAFEQANKAIEAYNKQDDELMDEALILFNQTQFSLSQSF